MNETPLQKKIKTVKSGLDDLRADLLNEFTSANLNRLGGEWWRLKKDRSYTFPPPEEDSPLGRQKKGGIDDYHYRLAIVAYCAGNEFLIDHDDTTLSTYIENHALWKSNKKAILLRDKYSGSKTNRAPCITKELLQQKLNKGTAVATIAKNLNPPVSPKHIYGLVKKYCLTLPSKKV